MTPFSVSVVISQCSQSKADVILVFIKQLGPSSWSLPTISTAAFPQVSLAVLCINPERLLQVCAALETQTLLSPRAENVNYLRLVVCVASSRCCGFQKVQTLCSSHALFPRCPHSLEVMAVAAEEKPFCVLERCTDVASALRRLLLFYYIVI